MSGERRRLADFGERLRGYPCGATLFRVISENEMHRLQAAFHGREPDSGWGYLVIGVVIAFFGLIVTAAGGGELGLFVVGIGGLIAQIGAIAIGVTVGTRRADLRRARQLLEHMALTGSSQD